MSSIEVYNPEKTTGYVVDEYVNYDRSVYRCRLDTPKPAGTFDDTYWNLVGYILDGSGVVNYSGETTEISFDDPEKFIYTTGNQTISGVKTFTDVIEMTKPEASSSKTSEKVVTVGWVNDPALSENVMHKDAENIIKRNNSIQYNNPNISTATNPTSNDYGCPIYFNDMYGNRTGYLRNGKLTNGNQYIGLQASRKIGTTEYYSSLDVGTKSDGSTFCQWNGNQIATTNNVVDLSSNQTINGKKTFTNDPKVLKAGAFYQTFNSDIDLTTTMPSSSKYSGIGMYDKNGRELGYARIRNQYTNSKNTSNLELIAIDPDTTHTESRIHSMITLSADGTTRSAKLNFNPDATSSDSQIATTYWANTTGNNIVHRTGTEEINGDKRFTNNIARKNLNITRGSAPTSDQYFDIYFTDKDNKWLGGIEQSVKTNKTTNLSLIISDTINNTTNVKGSISLSENTDTTTNTNINTTYAYAPTPGTSDNSTKIATTNFVKNYAMGLPDWGRRWEIGSGTAVSANGYVYAYQRGTGDQYLDLQINGASVGGASTGHYGGARSGLCAVAAGDVVSGNGRGGIVIIFLCCKNL